MIRDQKMWTWHVLAGCVILVLLGLHMLTMHMEGVIDVGGLNPASAQAEHEGGPDVRPIDYPNVGARSARLRYVVIYVVLLGAALFHGLYGAWNIFFELDPKAWLKKTVGALIVLVGVGLFVYGAWAAWAARGVALAARAATRGM